MRGPTISWSAWRRLLAVSGVVAVAAVAGVAGLHWYQSRDVPLSGADQRSWVRLVHDLDRRCVPPALRDPGAASHDRTIDRDVAALIGIAQRHPHAWFPDYETGAMHGNRVSWELTQVGTHLQCGRVDLVSRIFAAAGSLPGGWTPAAPPEVQARYTEALADLKARCASALRGTTDPAAVTTDVATMIAQDQAAPSDHLFRKSALAGRDLGQVPGFQPLGTCGAPAAIHRLARAAGISTDNLMVPG